MQLNGKFVTARQPGDNPPKETRYPSKRNNHSETRIETHVPQMWQVAVSEVNRIGAKNIIERLVSDWWSVAVIVKKPGGSHCFCIDYRDLNENHQTCILAAWCLYSTRQATKAKFRTNQLVTV